MNFKNLALGYVATAPSPATTGTSLVLGSGEGARFPQPSTDGNFYVTAMPPGENPNVSNSEILQVTARSTDTLTIVREQGDTTAKTIEAGWIILQSIYKENILDDDTMATASETTLATSKSTKAYVDTYGQNSSIYRQAIINGNADVSQRGTTFVAGANNDDTYTLDHWNLISDGNDVFDVSQEAITDLPGSNYAIKLDVETAKRGGIVQFLEAKDAQKFKGKTVSISFAVKSANISALRATVLSWAGTADSVTSDVVGTWGATPTWATNWADNATPADLTVASSWTTVKVEGIVLDESTVNNLALVIWTPNEETIGDIVYISQVQLCAGDVALPFMPKSFEEELRACMRYYEKSYDYAIAPGTSDTNGVYRMTALSAFYFYDGIIVFKVRKRIAPTTITLYSVTGASGKVRDTSAGADKDALTAYAGECSFLTYANNTLTATNEHQWHWTASAEL